jgi:hypothetical protein
MPVALFTSPDSQASAFPNNQKGLSRIPIPIALQAYLCPDAKI